jgi:multidrug resistance efflux pump
MTSAARRAWGIGLVAFFVVMCGSIAFAQWWAYNKNVPAYERVNAAHGRP